MSNNQWIACALEHGLEIHGDEKTGYVGQFDEAWVTDRHDERWMAARQWCVYEGYEPDGVQHEFLVDVELLTSVRIKAIDEATARLKLKKLFDCATVNFGSIDGEPVIGEASLAGENDDECLSFVERDGEAV